MTRPAPHDAPSTDRCQEACDQMTALSHGELASDRAEALQLHLADCPPCQQEWTAHERAAEQLAAAEVPPVPDSGWEAIAREMAQDAPAPSAAADAPIVTTIPISVARRRTALWIGGATAAAAILLVSLAALRVNPPIAEIVSVQGRVTLGDDVQLRPSQPLPAGSRVTTEPGAQMVLALRTGAMITLMADSELAIDSPSKLRLNRGGLLAQVSPQTQNLLVATPQAIVAVLGTRFRLEATEHETRLTVMEGTVRFVTKDGKAEMIVKTSSQAIATNGQISVPEVAIEEPDRDALKAVRLSLNGVEGRQRFAPGEPIEIELTFETRGPEVWIAPLSKNTATESYYLEWMVGGQKRRSLLTPDRTVRTVAGIIEQGRIRLSPGKPYRLVVRFVADPEKLDPSGLYAISAEYNDDRGTVESSRPLMIEIEAERNR